MRSAHRAESSLLLKVAGVPALIVWLLRTGNAGSRADLFSAAILGIHPDVLPTAALSLSVAAVLVALVVAEGVPLIGRW